MEHWSRTITIATVAHQDIKDTVTLVLSLLLLNSLVFVLPPSPRNRNLLEMQELGALTPSLFVDADGTFSFWRYARSPGETTTRCCIQAMP